MCACAQSDNVNRKRKQDQLAVLDELSRNRMEWYGLAAKNNELEVVCNQMEAEIKRLKVSVGIVDEDLKKVDQRPRRA